MDDNEIALLAARQHGVVTTAQLQGLGVDRPGIHRRCRAGRLHRLHRGVYLVGHAVPPPLAAEVAALFACGSASVISHRSAARLWGLPMPRQADAQVEVTVVGRSLRNKPGLQIYGTRAIDPRDMRRVRGIPTTVPARTLTDLAGTLRIDDLEVALLDARTRRLIDDGDLSEILINAAGRRGAGALRRLIELDYQDALTRSEAERRFFALVRTAALPKPRANARLGHLEVDFLWEAEKVVVEVDGYAYHANGRAFERDRERDATLAARGYLVLRVTWRQLMHRREAVAARLAAALSIRS